MGECLWLYPWQTPIPPIGRGTLDPAHTTVDLGEYLEHWDGTLEALPTPPPFTHNTVVYAHTTPGLEDSDPAYTTATVRRIAGNSDSVWVTAPQPAPRYTRLVAGRQIPTINGGPSWDTP